MNDPKTTAVGSTDLVPLIVREDDSPSEVIPPHSPDRRARIKFIIFVHSLWIVGMIQGVGLTLLPTWLNALGGGILGGLLGYIGAILFSPESATEGSTSQGNAKIEGQP